MSITRESIIGNIPKFLYGRVETINAKQKMIKVAMERVEQHPKYGKFLRRTTRLNVHWDNEQSISVGDLVAVMECRPISKIKHHTFVKRMTGKKEVQPSVAPDGPATASRRQGRR